VSQYEPGRNESIAATLNPIYEPVEISRRLMLQVEEEERPRLIVVPVQERMVIGCGGEDAGEPADLDFSAFNAAAQGMSQVHAAFVYRDDMLFIEDLNSANGTRINGLTIRPGRSYRLRSGDELEFGSFRLSARLMRPTAGGQFG
jgi:hypothetical protein